MNANYYVLGKVLPQKAKFSIQAHMIYSTMQCFDMMERYKNKNNGHKRNRRGQFGNIIVKLRHHTQRTVLLGNWNCIVFPSSLQKQLIPCAKVYFNTFRHVSYKYMLLRFYANYTFELLSGVVIMIEYYIM